ncbi:MAG TPA: hypothetical protein VLF69_04945 [Candidatus Saccharimonadales bacterium]|nr:hypothetical protein [Candidatus Saccharimonadales bacterium]
MNLQKLDQFHKTRPGHIVFGLIELAMSYGFASWALDDGSIWWWLIAFVLLFGALQNFFRAIFWRYRK